MTINRYVPAMVLAAAAHVALLHGAGLFDSKKHTAAEPDVEANKISIPIIELADTPPPKKTEEPMPDEPISPIENPGATLMERYAQEASAYKIQMVVEKTMARPPNPDRKDMAAPFDNTAPGNGIRMGTKDDVINSDDLSQPPVTRFSSLPPYPVQEKRLRKSGSVTALIIVNERGTVIEVNIENATSEAFAASVRSTLINWKFQPGMHEGKAVKFKMRVPFNFNLETEE
ncbi:MAG: TonB family protein [Verrucomicrobiota bacterium]|nr:TonB family protein [Verrucomicrobiota bacterium]